MSQIDEKNIFLVLNYKFLSISVKCFNTTNELRLACILLILMRKQWYVAKFFRKTLFDINHNFFVNYCKNASKQEKMFCEAVYGSN